MNTKDIKFKKSLGQNFLFDKNLLCAIVKDGDITADDTVLEIGAGAGTLTEEIAKVAKKVISFEIDNELKSRLEEVKSRYDNIEFVYADFMDANVNELFDGQARVVANIPYYITTPIIFKLIDSLPKFKSIMVLIQKEVAERFASPCGTKEYGITSVILQALFDVSMPRVIKKECFTPSPKIDSALCKMIPHNKYNIENFNDFKDLIHLSFSMRRKTLVNNLKNKFSKETIIQTLNKFGYSELVRPEEISVENFVNIYHELYF